MLHFWPAASAPQDQSASELLIFIALGGLDVTRYLPSLAPRQASRVLLSLWILCAAPELCCSGRCGERKLTHSYTHFILGLTTLGSGQVHGSSLQGPCSRSRPVPSAHLSTILSAVCDACLAKRHGAGAADILICLTFEGECFTQRRKYEQQGADGGPVQPVCGPLPSGEDPREGTDR